MKAHAPRPKPEVQDVPPAGNSSSDAEPGDGTALAGYVTPDLGPFECENCVHFTAPSTCDHAVVIADPEVNGQVDPEGCCNYFKSGHIETQEQEQGESNESY